VVVNWEVTWQLTRLRVVKWHIWEVLVGVLVKAALGWPIMGTPNGQDGGGGVAQGEDGGCGNRMFDVAEFELSIAKFENGCANIINYIFNCIPLDSVPVHSGDHSSVNSGIPPFHQNMLPLEWQYWQGPLPNFIPLELQGYDKDL